MSRKHDDSKPSRTSASGNTFVLDLMRDAVEQPKLRIEDVIITLGDQRETVRLKTSNDFALNVLTGKTV